MCDRKKRCQGCKKVLTIDKFGTHKVSTGENVPDSYCRKCRYARDSKTAFKRKKNIDGYINMIMFNVNARDY